VIVNTDGKQVIVKVKVKLKGKIHPKNGHEGSEGE
jgi:hypothetical protein